MEEKKIGGVNSTEVKTSKVDDKVEGVTFKKLDEMSGAELNALPVCNMELIRSESRKTKNIMYSVKFSMLPSLSVSGYISEALYYILQKVLELPIGYSRYNVKVHYRLSYGLRKDAKDDDIFNARSAYYYFEAVLFKGKTWWTFLSEEQILQIKVCELAKVLKPVRRIETDVDLASLENAKVEVKEI